MHTKELSLSVKHGVVECYDELYKRLAFQHRWPMMACVVLIEIMQNAAFKRAGERILELFEFD